MTRTFHTGDRVRHLNRKEHPWFDTVVGFNDDGYLVLNDNGWGWDPRNLELIESSSPPHLFPTIPDRQHGNPIFFSTAEGDLWQPWYDRAALDHHIFSLRFESGEEWDRITGWRWLARGRPEGRDPLLTARQSTHGDFSANARISQRFKLVFMEEAYRNLPSQQDGWKITLTANPTVNAVMNESLDMIALKLSRILSGRASEPDHWRDIAGYANLVVEQLEKERSENASKIESTASGGSDGPSRQGP